MKRRGARYVFIAGSYVNQLVYNFSLDQTLFARRHGDVPTCTRRLIYNYQPVTSVNRRRTEIKPAKVPILIGTRKSIARNQAGLESNAIMLSRIKVYRR